MTQKILSLCWVSPNDLLKNLMESGLGTGLEGGAVAFGCWQSKPLETLNDIWRKSNHAVNIHLREHAWEQSNAIMLSKLDRNDWQIHTHGILPVLGHWLVLEWPWETRSSPQGQCYVFWNLHFYLLSVESLCCSKDRALILLFLIDKVRIRGGFSSGQNRLWEVSETWKTAMSTVIVPITVTWRRRL